MNTFYVLVGSNINKRYHINQCHQQLRQLTQVVAFSSVYETAAVGSTGEVVEQESYYNLAYQIKSPMSVREFKQTICQSIEASLCRVRTKDKCAARTIDVDIVLYNNEIYSDVGITLPAPDILTASYVLLPLVEIAGDYVHPIKKQSLESILSKASFDRIIKKVDVITPDESS